MSNILIRNKNVHFNEKNVPFSNFSNKNDYFEAKIETLISKLSDFYDENFRSELQEPV